MEEELFIGLPADILAAATITYEFPKDKRYLIQNTPPELTRWPTGSMTRQNLRGDNFISGLFILDSSKAFTADLWVKKRNVIFFYTIRGYFSYRNNGHTFQILQGESAVFQTQPGHFKMQVLAGHHVYFFVYLKSDLLKILTSEFEGLRPLSTLIPQDETLMRHSGKAAQLVARTLFRLGQINKRGKIAAHNVEGIILELVSSSRLSTETSQIKPGKTTRDMVYQIRDFVVTEVSEGAVPSISEIAGTLHITPRRLGEVFHSLFGLPLREYITSIRMSKGYTLLKEQQKPVSDVANYLGYQNPANFSRKFKEHFGFPPSDLLGGNS